jgi:malic enzyme
VCIGDGFGSADCILREGSRLRALCSFHDDANGAGWYCPPSALENAWITTAEDMESFSQFCYGASKKVVRAHMNAYRQAMFKR